MCILVRRIGDMSLINMATISDVPIFSVGTHHSVNAGSVTVTEADLDDYLAGSIALKNIIKEAMTTGEYQGNPQFARGFVPGPINLHHNGFLEKTIKDATGEVDWTFKKLNIQGVPWIAGTFTNVPPDIAKSLEKTFPFRSVEILPNIKDPASGRVYKGAIRSTAFLSRKTAPAVKGQDEKLIVKYSEDQVIRLECAVCNINLEEDFMPKDLTQQETPTPAAEEALKFQQREAQMKRELEEKLEKAKKDHEKQLLLMTQKQDEQEALVQELLRAKEQSEVQAFFHQFSTRQHHNASGVKMSPSPAFSKIAREIVEATDAYRVLLFAEKEQPARNVMRALVEQIAELAVQDGLMVCLETVSHQDFEEPDKQQPPLGKRISQLMKDNEGIEYFDAWKIASKEREGIKWE